MLFPVGPRWAASFGLLFLSDATGSLKKTHGLIGTFVKKKVCHIVSSFGTVFFFTLR
jgi:hypothetical protein